MKALGGLRTRSWTFLRGGVEGSGDGEDGGELDGGDEDEEVEVHVLEYMVKVDAAKHFGSGHVLDLIKFHVTDGDIPQHHGGIKSTNDGRHRLHDGSMHPSKSALVCHVTTKLSALCHHLNRV